MSGERASARITGGHGGGFVVAAGGEITVAQTDGGQVCDLFAFDAADPAEFLSAGHTWVACERLFPAVGQSFVTNRRRPILTFLHDSTNGRHDMLFAACDARRYELLGHAGHRSCAANLRQAVDELGMSIPDALVPQPVNLFMNIFVDGRGVFEARPSEAAAGEEVRFGCERETVVVVSACPQDLTPINDGSLKDVIVEVR